MIEDMTPEKRAGRALFEIEKGKGSATENIVFEIRAAEKTARVRAFEEAAALVAKMEPTGPLREPLAAARAFEYAASLLKSRAAEEARS